MKFFYFLIKAGYMCLLLLFVFIQTNLFAQAKIDSLAENMLIYQRSYGGWPKAVKGKKVVYEDKLNDTQRKLIKAGANSEDATIDNKATSREIRYLVTAFKQTGNKEYYSAAKRGVEYLFSAQYKNGGWPQYFPDKHLYRAQITYNDDAIVNVLNIMQDIVEGINGFDVLQADYKAKAKASVDNAVNCIIKTQVPVNGKLTAWAAQYDPQTLLPAKARAFEPASLSSSESVGIVRFLMRLSNPSDEIKKSVTSALEWFEKVKIPGYTTKDVIDTSQPSGKDRLLVEDPNSVIWARFYDLNTFDPIFIGRDSIIKRKLSEIDNERRVGYAWYGIWPKKIIEKEFPKWRKANP